MDEISIKVTIGNREYPLKINRADEERVRNAVSLVQDRIRDYENQYPASDKYDYLAMCAMHFAGELVKLSDSVKSESGVLSKSITEIDSVIAKHLAKVNVH